MGFRIRLVNRAHGRGGLSFLNVYIHRFGTRTSRSSLRDFSATAKFILFVLRLLCRFLEKQPEERAEGRGDLRGSVSIGDLRISTGEFGAGKARASS